MTKSSFILGCDGKIQRVKRILSAIFSIFLFLSFATPSFAFNDCTLQPDKTTYTTSEAIFVAASGTFFDSVRVNNNASGMYKIVLKRGASISETPVPGGRIQNGSMLSLSLGSPIAGAGPYEISLRSGSGFGETIICTTPITVTVDPTAPVATDPVCLDGAITVSQDNDGFYRAGQPLEVSVDGGRTLNFAWYGEYYLKATEPTGAVAITRALLSGFNNTGSLISENHTVAGLAEGTNVISIQGSDGVVVNGCSVSITMCAEGDTNPACSESAQPSLKVAKFDYCMQVPDGDQQEACRECLGGSTEAVAPYEFEGKKVYTAVGCVRVDQQGLAADLIRLLLGIAGGVALLSVLAGAFIFSTSQGESGRVKQAKELITAAVSGLLFIIFSVIILDFIGVKILQIPGLG